jgi:ABC-type transport system substrate-binding protein
MKLARFLVLLAFGVTLWSADPAIGTWKLNTAKSKYSPGPAPKRATIAFEENAEGVKRTGESIDADGNKTSFEYTAKYDGKDYPVSGSELYDAIALKRLDDHTVESTLKKSGKVMTTARRVVSKDGKTMTLTITGINAKGEKIKNIAVYEKQ